MRAHQAAKAAMKKVHPELLIGLSLSLHDIQAVNGGDEVARHEWEEEFTHYLPYIKEDDFSDCKIIPEALSDRTEYVLCPKELRRHRWTMNFTHRH